MKHHNQDRGLRAENFFASKMNSLGLKFSFENDWYDFLVQDCKVEVKSCELTVKQKVNNRKDSEAFRCGHFDFTNEVNRDFQYNENCWVCFIMRHKEDFLLLGFARAKELNKKRYITIHGLSKIKLYSLDKWLKQIM